MAQRLTVDEGALKSVASRLLGTAGRLDTARGALENGLDAQGQCWGTSDEVARTFAQDYVHSRDEVVDGSTNLGHLLSGLGEAINNVNNLFSSTEHDNT